MFYLAYFSAYMSIIDALQVPGDLVSNAPPLVQTLQTTWRGSPDPIQQRRSHKTHNTAEATVTRANNMRNYHTVIWRFLFKKNTEPNLREQEQENMTTINGKIVVWEFLECLINRSIIDKRTTTYKDTGKEKQGWKPLRQYWIFRHPN